MPMSLPQNGMQFDHAATIDRGGMPSRRAGRWTPRVPRQNDPKAEPSTITATSASSALTMPTMTMSK